MRVSERGPVVLALEVASSMRLHGAIWRYVAVLASLSSCDLGFPGLARAELVSSVTYENKSGDSALVKLVGPTVNTVEVPDLKSRTVMVSPGKYFILVRYGTSSDSHRYSKGESFEVVEKETSDAREYSKITITLHPVVSGNYTTTPSSKAEFEAASLQAFRPVKIDPLTLKIPTPPPIRVCTGIEASIDLGWNADKLIADLNDHGTRDVAEILICSGNGSLVAAGKEWLRRSLKSDYPPLCKDSYPTWGARKCGGWTGF